MLSVQAPLSGKPYPPDGWKGTRTATVRRASLTVLILHPVSSLVGPSALAATHQRDAIRLVP